MHLGQLIDNLVNIGNNKKNNVGLFQESTGCITFAVVIMMAS